MRRERMGRLIDRVRRELDEEEDVPARESVIDVQTLSPRRMWFAKALGRWLARLEWYPERGVRWAVARIRRRWS